MSRFLWLMPPYEPENGGPYNSVLENLQHITTDDALILTFGKVHPEIRNVINERNLVDLEFNNGRNSIYGLGRIDIRGLREVAQANSMLVEGFYGMPLIYGLLFNMTKSKIIVVPHGAVGQPTSNGRFPKFFFRGVIKFLQVVKRNSLTFLAFSELESQAIESVFPSAVIEVKGRKIEFLPVRQDSRELSFTYMGRLSPEKGILETVNLFCAFQKLNDRYKLIIAGSGDSFFTKKLQETCNELELSESVIFLGWLNPTERASLLSRTSGLICLSPFESLGLSVLEAMQHRVPIFTTHGVGAAEFVKKLRVGFVNSNTNTMLSDFLSFEKNLAKYHLQYEELGLQQVLELIPENLNLWDSNAET